MVSIKIFFESLPNIEVQGYSGLGDYVKIQMQGGEDFLTLTGLDGTTYIVPTNTITRITITKE